MKQHLLIASIALLPLQAIAAEKHVHGEAELFIAIQDNQVVLELESPADNILGFEHKPSSKQEKMRLKDSLSTLASYTSLVTFEQGACKQLKHDIDAPHKVDHDEHDHEEKHSHDEHDHEEKHSHDEHDHEEKHSHDEHDHEEKHSHDHHDHSESEHSSFHVSYTLSCDDASSIKSLNVTAFKSFQGFESIDVNWVVNEKQGSQEATAKRSSVKLP